jgi:hemerythrin superfamily protein
MAGGTCLSFIDEEQIMGEISGFMSGDHDRIDVLLERFRGTAGEPMDEFASALEQHMKWEEQVIFPAFARKVGRDAAPSVDTMCLQHEEFRRQIDEIRHCPIGDSTLRRNLVDVFIESLADHNMAEENYIYPWIDDALDLIEKAAILTTLNTIQGGHCHDAQNIS